MIEVIKEILMVVGMCVVAVIIYGLFCAIINKFCAIILKFNRWRKNGCKLKCLCKPHKYKLVRYWRDTEEAVLECKKCGKKKRVSIDYDSIKDNFIRRISK